jgi:uncharacterized DUF497 family protein
VGSSIVHIYVPDDLSRQGLIISSIQEAFDKNSDLMKKHFEANANNYGEDRFLALGLSHSNQVFLYTSQKT